MPNRGSGPVVQMIGTWAAMAWELRYVIAVTVLVGAVALWFERRTD